MIIVYVLGLPKQIWVVIQNFTESTGNLQKIYHLQKFKKSYLQTYINKL